MARALLWFPLHSGVHARSWHFDYSRLVGETCVIGSKECTADTSNLLEGHAVNNVLVIAHSSLQSKGVLVLDI